MRGLWMALIPGAVGCGLGPNPVEIRDSVTPVPSSGSDDGANGPQFGSWGDRLHNPYAAGARFELYVRNDVPLGTANGWRVASLEPGVVEITAQAVKGKVLHAEVLCKAAGTAEIEVQGLFNRRLRGVDLVVEDVEEVHVLSGPRAIFDSAAPDAARVGSSIQVASTAVTPMLLRAFHAGHEVFGSGGLHATATGDATLELKAKHRGATRDWFLISPGADTQFAVRLQLGSAEQTLAVTAVNTAAVTAVDLLTRDPNGAEDGDRSVVVALGRTSNGQEVLAVPAAWTVDGEAQDKTGDLLAFTVKRGNNRQVQATVGAAVATAQVFADTVSVQASSQESCASARPTLLAVPALVVWARRRKRRSTRWAAKNMRQHQADPPAQA